MRQLNRLLEACSSVLYPAFCLHCDSSLESGSSLLCASCQISLEWIEPAERCRYCCSADISPKLRICSRCLQKSPVFHRVSAAFDEQGAARALLYSLKRGNAYLAKGAAAYMAWQWGRLEWPLPDAIVPIPTSLSRWLQQGYNPRALLAQELGKILGVPVLKLIKRVSAQTEAPLFERCTKNIFQEKKLLLVDDVWIYGRTMNAGAEALLDYGPAKIYGLTFCRGMD